MIVSLFLLGAWAALMVSIYVYEKNRMIAQQLEDENYDFEKLT